MQSKGQEVEGKYRVQSFRKLVKDALQIALLSDRFTDLKQCLKLARG
jgi:hypothetical protein